MQTSERIEEFKLSADSGDSKQSMSFDARMPFPRMPGAADRKDGGVESFLGKDPTAMFEDEDDAKGNGKRKGNPGTGTAGITTKEKREIGEELGKAMKRKSKEEIAKSQTLILTLSRYGASSRFGEYLKANGFKLTPTYLNKLDEAP